MSSRLAVVAVVGLLLAVGWLGRETFRLAELAGLEEVAAREAAESAREERVARSEAEARLEEVRSREEAARAEIARLEAELARSTAQVTSMAERLEVAAELGRARVAQARQAEREDLRPMPDGVRRCLSALHECLRTEGFYGLRFLRARSLDGDGLHGVEALYTHPDGLVVEFLAAATMRAVFDRSQKLLTLRFLDGSRSVGGKFEDLPEDGFPIEVGPMLPDRLEQRLPYLVRFVGVALDAEGAGGVAETPTLDREQRAVWLDRIERLLADAGTDEILRVRKIRDLRDAVFRDAELLATDRKANVLYGASCRRMAVEIDRKAGIVSLRLQDGSLRRGLAESTITADGMRILLPDVTPAQAIDAMMGMVVER